MKILVVEDEQHSREELMHVLAQLEPRASISSAENAAQAWATLEQYQSPQLAIDLIFLDIQMPGMNGLELAARIARLQRTSFSPPRTRSTRSPLLNWRAWITS
jgi:CheY-like chemotaxis protein